MRGAVAGSAQAPKVGRVVGAARAHGQDMVDRRGRLAARATTKSASWTKPSATPSCATWEKGDYAAIDRAFYVTAFGAGLRHGELCALRVMDVDWVRRPYPRAPQLGLGRRRHAEVAALKPKRADD